MQVDPRARLLVLDRSNKRVQVFDKTGELLDIWTDVLSGNDLVIDSNEEIHLVEGENRVSLLNLDGEVLGRWGEKSDTPGNFPGRPIEGAWTMEQYGEYKAAYDRDGYVLVKQFLPPEEFDVLAANVARYIRDVVRGLGEKPAFYQDRERPETLKQIQCMEKNDGFFAGYASAERWYDLARTLVGEPANYTEADEEKEVALSLEPGDALIHHGWTIHRADPNTSTTRHRQAFAMSSRARAAVRTRRPRRRTRRRSRASIRSWASRPRAEGF